MKRKVDLFSCTKPCANCPYRKDAPKRLWSKTEFQKLLETENDSFGGVYQCHKSNGSVCVGWLMNQDKRYFPSIALRLELIKKNISREYLDKLSSPSEMYSTVKQMIRANYPSLLRTKK